ncbi:acyltransferase family protein [Bacillus sp. H-16]|uniref:acyltransferase family protein n=1 Tax=Alteribacter salitolerans TaxID=2912333 RepID=UPI001964F7A7|nr:acyltransferase family protein [Alteribacter salitolerans]MBM7096041.1 acyltransferase family protein [Alteribacter salitolerans]
MSKKIIYEVYWIRALACLAVVLVHAVNTTLANYEGALSQFEEYFLIFIRFAAFFGTPAFVFISELLLARAYPDGVPPGFFKKRIRFLLVPFAVMGLIFALLQSDTPGAFFQNGALNLFAGGYTGYFVLIIFQFYILHVLLNKKLQRLPAAPVLLVAFAVQAAYIGFFNFNEPPSNQVAEYIWLRGHWIPFFGWIFYFTLGYYAGRHFDRVKTWIISHRRTVTAVPVIALGWIIVNVRTDFIDVVSSKRLDNIVYTIAVVALILFIAARAKKVPWPVMFVSKYSFNIYLLHTLVIYPIPAIAGVSPIIYTLFIFVAALIGSIAVAKLIHLWAPGKLLIGKKLPSPNRQTVKTAR